VISVASKLPAKKGPVAARNQARSASTKPAQTRPGPNSTVPQTTKKPSVVKETVKVGTGGGAKKVVGTAAKKTKKVATGSFNNKFAPRQRPTKSVVSYRHIIAAEFWVGLILIMTNRKPTDKPTNELEQAGAFIAVMGILFAIAGGGRNPARISAGLGGLVVLTLAVMSTGKVSNRFSAVTSPKHQGASVTEPPSGAKVPLPRPRPGIPANKPTHNPPQHGINKPR
jgi:hypothetical protein